MIGIYMYKIQLSLDFSIHCQRLDSFMLGGNPGTTIYKAENGFGIRGPQFRRLNTGFGVR